MKKKGNNGHNAYYYTVLILYSSDIPQFLLHKKIFA